MWIWMGNFISTASLDLPVVTSGNWVIKGWVIKWPAKLREFFNVFFCVFSKSKKHDFLRFFEWLTTFSRTLLCYIVAVRSAKNWTKILKAWKPKIRIYIFFIKTYVLRSNFHSFYTLIRTLPTCWPCVINLNAASTSSVLNTVVCSGFTKPSWIPLDSRSRTVCQSGFPGWRSASIRIPWNEMFRRNIAIPTTVR